MGALELLPSGFSPSSSHFASLFLLLSLFLAVLVLSAHHSSLCLFPFLNLFSSSLKKIVISFSLLLVSISFPIVLMPLVLLLKSDKFYVVSRLYCFVSSNVSDDSVIVFLFSFLFFRIFLLCCAFLSKELSFSFTFYFYYLFIFNCVNKFLCAFFHIIDSVFNICFFSSRDIHFFLRIFALEICLLLSIFSSGCKDIPFLFLANVYFYILTFLIRLVGLYVLLLYFCFHTLPV